MHKRRIGVTIAATAASIALIGAGIANAGPAPTADYQLCGYAYQGTIVDNTDPPASAPKLAGKSIAGVLKNLSGATQASYTATTGADGGYCITGDSSMVNTVIFGGWVELSSPGGTVSHAQIKTADFLDHKVSGFESATNFHIAY